MQEKYLTLPQVAQLLGVTEKWVYRKSKELNGALALLNGKPIRPMRFDRERLDYILSGGSLKIEGTNDLPKRKVGRI